jgi:hypothetical protein
LTFTNMSLFSCSSDFLLYTLCLHMAKSFTLSSLLLIQHFLGIGVALYCNCLSLRIRLWKSCNSDLVVRIHLFWVFYNYWLKWL